MKIEKKSLKNGAKIIGVKMPGVSSVVISFGFRTGSRTENPEVLGMSHFLEHMMFKGSKKYPNTDAISRAADSIGGQYNAYTGKEYTVYYIKASKENFDIALDIVGDMVTTPILKESELVKERGTIIEEIKMYEDNPNLSIFGKIEETIFGDGELGREIAGSSETVKNITAKNMREYFDKYYSGSNTRVIVAGNLPDDYQAKVSLFASRFKSGPRTEWGKPELGQKRLKVIKKPIEQAHVGFSIPGCSLFDKDGHILQVISSILGGYMSARLFSEIREKRGWAYRIWAFSDEMFDAGYLGVFGGVKKDKAVSALEIIRDEILNLSETVTTEEITRAIENIKGSSALKFDSPEEVSNYLMPRVLLADRVELPKERVDKISKITKADIKRVAKELFKSDNFYVTVIGPFKNQEKFAKILNQK